MTPTTNDEPRVMSRAEFKAAATSLLLDRYQFSKMAGMGGVTFNGMRDLFEIFGYERQITARQYRDRYARGGIAKRVVEAYPKATWRGGLELIEDEDPKKTTKFEQAWLDLDKRFHMVATLQRVDILAGLSTFAVLLIGAPGQLDTELVKGSPDDLLYLQPFSGGGGPVGRRTAVSMDLDADCTIHSFDLDIKSPRFGLPLFYQLRRTDIANADFLRPVHFSRIIHIAEGLLDDDVYGKPTMESCWNLFDDLDKVTGGGAEAFFQRANQGMNLNIQKDASFTQDDLDKMATSAEEYRNNISRILKTREVDVNMLGSDVANFSQPSDAILTQIAGTTGIPKRILTGSEMGELASSQDRDNWKDQVNGRQTGYAGPFIVRPLVDRLCKYGYLPTPKDYEVRWAHIQTMTEEEKAAGALQWAQSATAEGPVFTRDEVRDHWYGMEALPKPDVNTKTGEHTSPETGLPLNPTVDPHTQMPLLKPPVATTAPDPKTGLPVEVDTKTGLPVHVGELTPEEQAKARKQAMADRLKAAAVSLHEDWTIEDGALTRVFPFNDRRECAAFISALAQDANLANHHPDISTNECTVKVQLVTHQAGDTITEADYQSAARADQLAVTYRAATEGPHKYASVQINIEGPLSEQILAFGRAIPTTELAEDGQEMNPHVTLKYGIKSDDPYAVEALLKDTQDITFTLGPLALFTPEDKNYEVLVISVASYDLRRLNALITSSVDVVNTYPVYKPHVTIAYLQKGMGDKYVGKRLFDGETVTTRTLDFCPAEDEPIPIMLGDAPGTLPLTAAEEATIALLLAEHAKGKPIKVSQRADGLAEIRVGEDEPVRETPSVIVNTPDVPLVAKRFEYDDRGRVIRMIPEIIPRNE